MPLPIDLSPIAIHNHIARLPQDKTQKVLGIPRTTLQHWRNRKSGLVVFEFSETRQGADAGGKRLASYAKTTSPKNSASDNPGDIKMVADYASKRATQK